MTLQKTLGRFLYVWGWRLRYFWLDTKAGMRCRWGLAAVLCLWAAWQAVSAARGWAADEPVQAFWVQIVIMIVSILISYALTPKTPDSVDQPGQAPRVEDGAGVRMVFGEVWITDPMVIGWRKMGTQTIRGKKSGFNGRPIIGYWYKQLFHFALCRGPVDAVLEFRGGDKTAWTGEMTASADVQINKRDLWGGSGTGGEGGIEGPLEFLFGDSAQTPNSYLASALGAQQPAYRGLLTALFKGGLWGAFSPYPKAASFKVRRILEGWERSGGAWYPEKAEIFLSERVRNTVINESFISGIAGYSVLWGSSAGFTVAADGGAAALSITGGADAAIKRPLDATGSLRSVMLRFKISDRSLDDFACIDLKSPSGNYVFGFNMSRQGSGKPSCYVRTVGGSSVDFLFSDVSAITGEWYRFEAEYDESLVGYSCSIIDDSTNLVLQNLIIPLPADQTPSVATLVFRHEGAGGVGKFAGVEIICGGTVPDVTGMNPAHMLHQSITDRWMGGEPEAQINDASFRAAADTLHAEGFGLCTEWTSTNESVEAFQQRICNVIGANLSRSPVDGKWYLDLIRGGYNTSTLPVLTDDDILEYTEQPGTLSDAVNQVTVEWRDPLKREDRSTAPVQSLGGIQMAGAVVGQVSTYREIPEETLALRAAARDLQAKARPLRRITGKVTRAGYAWRPGQVIKLQSAKRGIASMFCRVGDIDRGTLRSGAVSLSLLQDVFGLPQAVYVQPGAGSGTGDDDVPKAVAASAVQEVPYALLAALQPPGELAALPGNAGFLFAVATPAGAEIDYSLQVDAGVGAGYEQQAESDWSATALTVAAADRMETVIGITAARGLEDAAIGAMVLWGDEICRLDAIDLIAGTVILGRGCADTVPAPHVAGERLWVIDDSIALDVEQYSASDSVSAKLLPRTGGQALGIAFAPAVGVTFASRQARPYPPAAVTINGGAYPAEVFETADIEWRHRDRIASGASLVDQAAASVGPEAGVTYTVRWYLDGVLVNTASGITGTAASHVPAADGLLRVEVEAVRDGLTSWQMQVIECDYRVTPYSEYVDENGDVYADQNGDTYNG